MVDIDQYVGTVPCTFRSLDFEDGLFALMNSISQRNEYRGTTRRGMIHRRAWRRNICNIERHGKIRHPNEPRECGGSFNSLAYPYHDTFEDDFSFFPMVPTLRRGMKQMYSTITLRDLPMKMHCLDESNFLESAF